MKSLVAWWEEQRLAVGAMAIVFIGLAPPLGFLIWQEGKFEDACEEWIRTAAPEAVRRFDPGTYDRRGERCAVIMPDGSMRVKP